MARACLVHGLPGRLARRLTQLSVCDPTKSRPRERKRKSAMPITKLDEKAALIIFDQQNYNRALDVDFVIPCQTSASTA